MKKYLQKIKHLILAFYSFSIKQIPREKNAWADTLSKLTAIALHDLCTQAFFKVLEEPSIIKLAPVL